MKKTVIKNKERLLLNADAAYHRFLNIITQLPSELKYHDVLSGNRDKNIRDLCAQIIGWQSYLLGWYTEGMKDRLPDIPAKGYTWRIVDALEMKIWQQFQKTSLDEALTYLETSQREIMDIINSHTDLELFGKKQYRWTRDKTMAYYFMMFVYQIYIDKTGILEKILKKHQINIDSLHQEAIESDNDIEA